MQKVGFGKSTSSGSSFVCIQIPHCQRELYSADEVGLGKTIGWHLLSQK
jgi:hypothetical protein